jgi:hypothetical protein
MRSPGTIISRFDWIIGLDKENQKDGWPYRFAIILLLCYSLYFFGGGSIYLLANNNVPDLKIPVELRQRLAENHKIISECKQKIEITYLDSQQILNEILILNNIVKLPDEKYTLKRYGNKWQLLKK